VTREKERWSRTIVCSCLPPFYAMGCLFAITWTY